MYRVSCVIVEREEGNGRGLLHKSMVFASASDSSLHQVSHQSHDRSSVYCRRYLISSGRLRAKLGAYNRNLSLKIVRQL